MAAGSRGGCRRGPQKFSRNDSREAGPLQGLWVGAGHQAAGLVLTDRLRWPEGRESRTQTWKLSKDLVLMGQRHHTQISLAQMTELEPVLYVIKYYTLRTCGDK